MARNKRNIKNKKFKKKSNIIRCKTHSKPVLSHEVCDSFSPKNNTNNERNCENCKNSF